MLGWLVKQPPGPLPTYFGPGLTVVYFLFFLTMPVWSRMGQFKTVPDRVTTHD